MRTSLPEYGNKYYNTTSVGGWSQCIKGKCRNTGRPYDGLNVLANCVGYANGRFAEIIGKNKIEYQLTCNAENFIEKAKGYGLEIGQTPKAGAIMCWEGIGSLAGHVAIVERVNNDGSVFTSESGYNSSPFWNSTRTNSNGRWGQNSNYRFRGFIYNPANPEPEPTKYNLTRILRKGCKGNDVKELQNTLISKGYSVGSYGADSIFGNATANAVRQFQKNNGLVQDSIVGKNTAHALGWLYNGN